MMIDCHEILVSNGSLKLDMNSNVTVWMYFNFSLVIKAPGMAELDISLRKPNGTADGVSVWKWSGSALDEGADTSKWFSDYLGKASRLVRFNGVPKVAQNATSSGVRGSTPEPQKKWRCGGSDDHLWLRSNFKTYWDCVQANPLPQPIRDAITEAGFMGVLLAGSMRHDAGLISTFLDRWRPETHTFHLRFGEATVTLEDVYYILGLRSVGRPILPIPGDVDALLVYEILGVAPDPQQDTAVIKKGEIKISWLVRQFGDCSRLHSVTGHDHERELLYHTRAHLLLLIGSTVPNYSGYPSIGYKTKLCGSMTLLQVWIYEHCTALAPRQRDPYLMQHPRALRWMVPLDGTTVQTHSLRGIRYDLDTMSEDSLRWMPYGDSAVEARYIPELELSLMSAHCPLFYLTWVEWCYTDRVTRQFGYLQQVPTDSPLTDHDSFHRGQKGWPLKFTRVRELWESRHTAVLGPPSYRRTHRPMCVVDYPEWYDRVTRRFMINPRIWRDQQGFQGSQGHLRVAVEGLSAAYHQIRESGVAEDDDNVDEALQGLHGILDAIGFPYLLQRPPHPPPATPRTSGAHARRPGTAFVNAAPAPRDGWEPWPRPSGGEGSSFYTSSGSGWGHSFQGHGHTDRTRDHFIQGEGDPHTSTWGQSSQVPDVGGSSWGRSTQSHDAGTSTFGHPSQGHNPYVGASTMGHTTQTSYAVPSAWATGSSWGHSTQTHYGHLPQAFPQPTYSFPPETGGSGFSFQTPTRGFDPCEEQDDDDEEVDPPIQLRQQPRRAVKGKGRLCHTGGRFCG
ncbi:hypothetical protein AgCh_037018 [Apium graveolens]